MTFDAEKVKLTRKPFFIVKLELDTTITAGGNEYHCSGRSPLGQLFHSSIPDGGYDPTPTKMAIAAGLGFRGSIKVTFEDFNFGTNGTYWGKLLANNPYYLDRVIKVYTGFYDGETFDWANFKEKLYFIKKLQGPDSNGKVTITAHDPLTLLDSKEAIIPQAPNAKLAAALNSTATGTLDIEDNTNFSATGGVCRINDEYMAYSGISGADSIVTTTRAQYGTDAASHDADDSVIPCYSFNTSNVVDLIRDLIEDYSPIDHASYIPDTDWNTQRDSFLTGANCIGVYDGGTPIKKEIQSLCEQFRVSIWWDDEAQEIKLVHVGPLTSVTKRVNVDSEILGQGETVKRDPNKVITETIVYYNRRNHAIDEDDKKNYANWYIASNTEAETGSGKAVTKEVYAKNMPGSGSSSANDLVTKTNAQFEFGLIEYDFRLDIRDADLMLGQIVEAYTDKIQGTDGLPVPTSFMVIERDQIKPTVYQYKAVRTGFALGSKYRRIAPASMDGDAYTTATTEEQAKYLFIADIDEQFSNDDPGHWIY